MKEFLWWPLWCLGWILLINGHGWVALIIFTVLTFEAFDDDDDDDDELTHIPYHVHQQKPQGRIDLSKRRKL